MSLSDRENQKKIVTLHMLKMDQNYETDKDCMFRQRSPL